MHILVAGKAAFLEFLRNLTPTILMTSVAVLFWFRLDFGRVDLSNWSATGAFFACAITAALSWFANVSQFFDRAFAPIPELDRGIRLLKLRGHTTGTLLTALLLLAWRRRPVIVVEAILVVMVAFAAVQVGAHAAVSAAATAIQNGV